MSSPFFSDALKSLIGYSVGVFSNDGTLMKGTMVDVKKDYLIVQTTEEKYIYHHLAQVKSVSKNSKAVQANVIAKDYLQAEQLKEILEQCKYSWVTVNCYNDQFVTGFLSRVFDDHLILISGEEKIIMQNACIINIFPGVYETEEKERNEPEEKELSSQVKARDEITENEAPVEDKEELEEPEEKEYSLQVEARDEIEESEAFLEDKEELDESEEKEHLLQAEVQNEITESEASVEDKQEPDEPEEKEYLLQAEAQ
ncbi:DUF2642 domain-containing protein, partial [Domibacillus robiginosus]|uniref:DUF2642 domain-containing protein n=1 Tax=Domibacillus robiginosus TaxID=1071054 RepID=UPI00067BFE87